MFAASRKFQALNLLTGLPRHQQRYAVLSDDQASSGFQGCARAGYLSSRSPSVHYLFKTFLIFSHPFSSSKFPQWQRR